MPLTLPTAAYDPTKSVIGRQSILAITIATVTTNLLVNYVGHEPGLERAGDGAKRAEQHRGVHLPDGGHGHAV